MPTNERTSSAPADRRRRDPAAPVTLSFSKAGDEAATARLHAKLGEPVALDIALRSSELETGYGRLRVFDGDPNTGGQMILSQTVQGVSGGEVVVESFTWRPRKAGLHVLHATYVGPNTGERQVTQRLAVSVER
jgi:hypothetical protein